MSDQQRFEGRLAQEYDLITLAYPDFAVFQFTMVRHLTQQLPEGAQILEIGTGNGFTTDILLTARPDWRVVTLDNDQEMVAQAAARSMSGTLGPPSPSCVSRMPRSPAYPVQISPALAVLS